MMIKFSNKFHYKNQKVHVDRLSKTKSILGKSIADLKLEISLDTMKKCVSINSKLNSVKNF